MSVQKRLVVYLVLSQNTCVSLLCLLRCVHTCLVLVAVKLVYIYSCIVTESINENIFHQIFIEMTVFLFCLIFKTQLREIFFGNWLYRPAMGTDCCVGFKWVKPIRMLQLTCAN